MHVHRIALAFTVVAAQIACGGSRAPVGDRVAQDSSGLLTKASGGNATSAALPIVFVHGSAGSAAQYASVARRFVSNGYPADRIRAFEYDSSSAAAVAAAPDGIDALVDGLREEFGVERINLVGHSLGTRVSATYLSVPSRAAKIAHYVGVDGFPVGAQACGIVECMGIFRGSSGDVCGHNLYLNSTQSHVEAETSPESFAAQYRWFVGEAPATTLILPEPPGQVRIAGRAVNFPQNTGVDGGTLQVWEIDAVTGARRYAEPVATTDLGPGGEWGPVPVNGQQHYELALSRPDSTIQQHFYYQPFLRTDHWVRLLSSPPTSPTALNTVIGPHHAAAVVIRNREWWTTHPGGPKDTLFVGTTSASMGEQPPEDVLVNVASDGISIGGSAIGVHLHDHDADGVSSLAIIPYFASVSFQTGVDVYMPAANPPDGTITFRNDPRGDASRPQVLHVPNWASSAHRISLNFNDYVQDINTWGECKRQQLCHDP